MKKKFLLFYMAFMSVLTCFSCSPSHYNLEKQVGLYQVVDRQCEVTEGLYNPCQGIRFIELIKGTFHGIGPDQVALVMWRVKLPDATSGPLYYTAGEIVNHQRLRREQNTVWLTHQKSEMQVHGQLFLESEEEYFLINKDVLSDYHFLLEIRNRKTDQVFTRRFHYKITPVKHEDVKGYNLVYPEDM